MAQRLCKFGCGRAATVASSLNHGGIVSPEQKRYMAALTNLGYKCVVAKGVEAAIKEITEYLRGA